MWTTGSLAVAGLLVAPTPASCPQAMPAVAPQASKEARRIGSRLLATPSALYLGRRSYSLFLLHWPIYVLFR